jgi:hypothetical protein
MLIRIIGLVIPVSLCGCAAQPQHDSSYYDQRAVIAYKAKDFVTAREQWSKALALDSNSVRALNNLAYLLYSAMGGSEDQHRAVTMWTRAAHMGHSESQWHLGIANEEGTAVTQSNIEAYAWFRCAIASAEAASDREKDISENRIRHNAQIWLTNLTSQLSEDQSMVAEQLAKQYIDRYARRKVDTQMLPAAGKR